MHAVEFAVSVWIGGWVPWAHPTREMALNPQRGRRLFPGRSSTTAKPRASPRLCWLFKRQPRRPLLKARCLPGIAGTYQGLAFLQRETRYCSVGQILSDVTHPHRCLEHPPVAFSKGLRHLKWMKRKLLAIRQRCERSLSKTGMMRVVYRWANGLPTWLQDMNSAWWTRPSHRDINNVSQVSPFIQYISEQKRSLRACQVDAIPRSLPAFQPTQHKFKAPLYIICIRKVSKAQARSDWVNKQK